MPITFSESMVKNTEPKKHHYVPQFLLRNFSLGKKKRLYVFDKKTSKSFPSHVIDSGHENHFYRDEHLGYESDIEVKLSNLEDKCAPIIEKIISEQSIAGLSESEISLICLFTAVQMTRTNKTREFLSELNQKIAKWVVDAGGDPNKDVENFRLLTESEVKSSAINILNTFPGELGNNLLDKEIGLLKAPKSEIFYLSDSPVTMHNHFPRPNRGNLGVNLKGIEIHLPISPRLSLTFMCAEMLSEIREKLMGTAYPVDMSEAESLVQKVDNKTTSMLRPENVEFQNSLQVSQSSRFIYSRASGFELAKDMLRTNPELAESEWVTVLSNTLSNRSVGMRQKYSQRFPENPLLRQQRLQMTIHLLNKRRIGSEYGEMAVRRL